MAKLIWINSNFTVLPRTQKMTAWDPELIKEEPMFYRADVDFAYKYGGNVTKEFIDRIPSSFHPKFIDTKVTMLMPGMYPCIPGWHLDDVPRTRLDGQPDHDAPGYKAEHIMAVVGDASLTSFAIGQVYLSDVPLYHGPIYGVWDKEIEQKVKEEFGLRECHIPERELIMFNWQSLHRGNPATKFGWRWFGRASRNTDLTPTNQIRRQTNVYLSNTTGGW